MALLQPGRRAGLWLHLSIFCLSVPEWSLMVLWGCKRPMSLSQDCAAPAGHVWALVIGYFLSFSQTAATLKRGNLRLSMLLSLVRTSQPFLLLTLVLLLIPHTDSSSEAPELLLRFVPQSPKPPLAVLPVGQWVISHSGNWVWDICLMPSTLQFTPRGTFYKFSGIQGQCAGQESSRSPLSCNCLYI